MVDWWQPILYIGAGGVVSLVTAIVTSRLTTNANRESDERQANQRVEEEQRQEIRKTRRDRMQPVVDFLESSKRYGASTIVSEAVAAAVEGLPSEEAEQHKRRATGYQLDKYDLLRLYIVAMTSAQSVPGLMDELQKLNDAQRPNVDLETRVQWAPALASCETLVEQYIVSANPSPIRPAGIESA